MKKNNPMEISNEKEKQFHMILKRTLVKRNSVLINGASEHVCTNYSQAKFGQIINVKDAKIKRLL